MKVELSLGIIILCLRTPGEGGVSLMSFNTGLTSHIPYLKERSRYIAGHVAQSRPDFLCLQEVWHYRDLYQIVKENSATYPYSFSAIHSGTSSLLSNSGYHWPPCGSFAAFRMFFKMWWYGCTTKKNDNERLDCVNEKAGFMDLPQECITCLTMSKITAKCLGTIKNEMNVPGLLILSKRKLLNSKMVYFRPNVKQILPRGYLLVEVPELGTVACTHTTANLGEIYYEPNLKSVYKSWEEQNLEESRILIRNLSPFPSAVVMGDFNSSPTVPNKRIQGDFEVLTPTGIFISANNYTNPYIDLWGQCTFCSGNTLMPYKTDWILDHILIRGLPAQQAQRVMDQEIPGLKVHPSDHYGIQVVVT